MLAIVISTVAAFLLAAVIAVYVRNNQTDFDIPEEDDSDGS